MENPGKEESFMGPRVVVESTILEAPCYLNLEWMSLAKNLNVKVITQACGTHLVILPKKQSKNILDAKNHVCSSTVLIILFLPVTLL